MSRPISAGKQDRSPLFMRMISLSVADMLPRLAGTQPRSGLCAATMTETGEFPTLSGRSEEKRLWLMKMASRSLSKSAGGTPPSNSLKRRSRYLREGRPMTTAGNFPANRLLLMSSS